MDIFTNDWWNWIFSTYTFTIGAISSLIVIILKCIAVVHPNEKTNTIVGLLQGWIFGFHKWDGRMERRIETNRMEIAVDRREIAVNRKENAELEKNNEVRI